MTDHHRFKLGNFEGIVISLGSRPVDLSSMFSDVPQEEREAAVVQHGIALDQFAFGLNILYLEHGSQRILVDTGLPEGVVEGVIGLMPALRSIGIDPNSITHVILTHAHRDHIGGLLNRDGTLSYPNARYAMWKTEWEDWTLPERLAQKDEATASSVSQMLTPISDRIELIHTDSEIIPGIFAVAAPGHTNGHIALLIQSGDEVLLHVADALHQPIQMENPLWCPGFDADKDASRHTRRTLLDRAARDHTLFLAYHFGFPALGRVIEQNGAWKWQPV